MSRQIVHIIVAAGTGSRYGARLPKQFLPLDGDRVVLMSTIDAFRQRQGEEVILVISREMEKHWLDACRAVGFESPRLVYGGATRHQSVANALKSLGTVGPDDIVTVHDGARPVVSAALIERILEPLTVGRSRAVVPAVAVTDSLRQIEPDGMSRAVDRSLFRAVQTPQAFIARDLIAAFEQTETAEMTDEATAIERAGLGPIELVDGDVHNIKITNPGDFEIARIYLQNIHDRG